MLKLPTHPCYLDGVFTPLAEARISVLDRGFLFGDGVYEVIPVHAGRPFRLDDHLKRLERSLSQAHLGTPLSMAEWTGVLRQLVALCTEATGAADQLLYLQITRGLGAERQLVIDPALRPTVFAMANPHQPPDAAQRHHGVRAVTARDFRWERGTLKTTSLMGAVLARHLATEQDAAETLLIHEGHLAEGSNCNVWVVVEDALVTPPPGPHVLPGVRLQLVRELCEEEGIPCSQRPVAEAELNMATEILLSSAGRELLPVTTLDGQPVGHGALRGKPGPVFGRLYEAYQRAKQRPDG